MDVLYKPRGPDKLTICAPLLGAIEDDVCPTRNAPKELIASFEGDLWLFFSASHCVIEI